MEDIIEFGKIVSTHGLKGEVKVYSYTDNIKNILKLKTVYVNNIEYKVESMKIFKNMFLMKLKGIDDIDIASRLIDFFVYRKIIENESNEDQGFFVKDLIGLSVIDETGKKLGILTNIFQTGANDVYEITTEDKKSIYLPAIKDVVKKIDINSKIITVRIMEGLI